MSSLKIGFFHSALFPEDLFKFCVSKVHIFIDEEYSIVWIYYSLFEHSFVERHPSSFQLLIIINKAVGNIFTSFHMNISFHFSGRNAQECNCWVIWEFHI